VVVIVVVGFVGFVGFGAMHSPSKMVCEGCTPNAV
jgi:hypothetical protein